MPRINGGIIGKSFKVYEALLSQLPENQKESLIAAAVQKRLSQ